MTYYHINVFFPKVEHALVVSLFLPDGWQIASIISRMISGRHYRRIAYRFCCIWHCKISIKYFLFFVLRTI